MKSLAMLNTLELPFPLSSPSQSHHRKTISISNFTTSSLKLKQSLHHYRLLYHHKKPLFNVACCAMQEGGAMELGVEDAALLVSTCITRTLPPALTVEQGFDRIQGAIDELKTKEPCSSSGMLRFRVAVSPSTRAWNWFCSQPESSVVFPQFFLSKDQNSPTYKSLALDRTRGVFGLGAAVYFKGCCSRASRESALSQSFLSAKSTCPVAYGFLDIHFETTSLSLEHKTGSFYLFIPQIELDDSEDIPVLIATLAWNDSFICTLEEAIKRYEFSFYQVRHSFWSEIDDCNSQSLSSALGRLKMVEDNSIQMVCVRALLLGRSNLEVGTTHLKEASCCSSQFLVRLSSTLAIASNMIDPSNQGRFFMEECPNINTFWAKVIVEECTRLGLTYFCVAPGSRSSPLALAASSHPLTTSVACIDERSLAFHAIGYARGSHKPAVVITTSGTAVSNLFPAVVEASQDFVPLLLLTADRPPELLDVGANQAINQVNHFGQYVRHYFGLPTPSDNISARMVLTTVDYAVYMSTSSPYGPVHVNCPFREPLDGSSSTWNSNCLKGLEFWMPTADPFTSYIRIQHRPECNLIQTQMNEVLKLIEGAKRGLLLLGAIHTEDDRWAALLLAKYLKWPVVADILSGLRLRKDMASFSEVEENIVFIDHLDHLLLSEPFRSYMQVDVIVQVGSRITSKRISQMLEHCFPCSYIMVDRHPNRHDPSHIVTHRIHCTINQFANCLIKACGPRINSKWRHSLQAMDTMVSQELSFNIDLEDSLTEPYVMHGILKQLHCETAMFLGNSMPIRDADMYGSNRAQHQYNASVIFGSGLPCHWIQVMGNRGASGIDGLLSTAIGFTIGCNKRVLCIIGDVSFLHDTNGLTLLKQRISRKPIVILVINNHGGAIFSLLPIAVTTEQNILDQFFYTSHDVSVHSLCMAHGNIIHVSSVVKNDTVHRVKHMHVQTKTELHNALCVSQLEEVDCVIEVESNIETNATFHSNLRNFARQAADRAFSIISKLSVLDSVSHCLRFFKVIKMEYSSYRVQLCAPTTSSSTSYNSTIIYREGFIVTLSLEDGSTGFGEVAPLEIHQENMLDVQEQLQFLIHVMEGAKLDCALPFLNGSISSWIWRTLGIPPDSIYPSVRCGLEMAMLNAIATTNGSSLLDIIHPQSLSTRPLNVKICALVDSNGGPQEIAHIAKTLVDEGFAALKIKVARRPNPIEDGAVIQEIREKVGNQVELRADANRNWTYHEAIQFANSVRDCCLQYIEEPVRNVDDIVKFCEETGLPVALDESISIISNNTVEFLQKYNHSGIVAVVIKPNIVGGFENAALIARWAQQNGKMAVISSAFESGLSLSAYIQFSCYLDLQNEDICRISKSSGHSSRIAHGLGTYRWLKEDVTTQSLNIHRNLQSGFVEASVVDTGRILQQFQINNNALVQTFTGETVQNYQLLVTSDGISFSANVLECGQRNNDCVLVFLHGFLGTGGDWIPIMKSISRSTRCIAIDLPGHGVSKLQDEATDGSTQVSNLSMEVVSSVLCRLFDRITTGRVTLVGYSMGARIALYMSLKCSNKVQGAIIISGSPGLADPYAREIRKAEDDFRAKYIASYGLEPFLDFWYAKELWSSLRSHPSFNKIYTNRLQHHDLHNLARVLSDLSTGRQQPLWEDLKYCNLPLLFIVGESDAKFKKLARDMCHGVTQGSKSSNSPEIVEVPDAGHAVHLENPLPVINAISKFLKRMRRKSAS